MKTAETPSPLNSRGVCSSGCVPGLKLCCALLLLSRPGSCHGVKLWKEINQWVSEWSSVLTTDNTLDPMKGIVWIFFFFEVGLYEALRSQCVTFSSQTWSWLIYCCEQAPSVVSSCQQTTFSDRKQREPLSADVMIASGRLRNRKTGGKHESPQRGRRQKPSRNVILRCRSVPEAKA